MNNMMKQYLGDEYSENRVRNFCLYWMKASKGSGDEWRRENDLDCLYFDGDLRADTLMSAWTPIKWVAEIVNREYGFKFCKRAADHEDPDHYLKLLAEDTDAYLPPGHKMVRMLNRFLKLAEKRCNYILLPDRAMNTSRYRSVIRGKDVWMYDEVPVTLAHLYDKDSLGRFFLGTNGEVDTKLVRDWVLREHLEPGFFNGRINRSDVTPYMPWKDPYEAIRPESEYDLYWILEYMIDFLEARQKLIEEEAGIKKDRLEKPEGITCDRLCEVYQYLSELDKPYIWIEKLTKNDHEETLCRIEDMSFGHGETDYGVDGMGIELPWSRYEWVELTLKCPYNEISDSIKYRIKVDALHTDRLSADGILYEHGIRIPTETELKSIRQGQGESHEGR